MYQQLKEVDCVGFDLDGTLYQETPEMQDRVRTKIAESILELNLRFKNTDHARIFFDQRYDQLHSGTMVLAELGISREEGSQIIDNAITNADIFDLLKPDEKLIQIIDQISSSYKSTYLLTSSLEKSALKKLEKLGINPKLFSMCIYGDEGLSKSEGSAFTIALARSRIQSNNHAYIGNTKADIIKPNKLGMKTIAVWNDIQEADIYIPHVHNLEEVLL